MANFRALGGGNVPVRYKEIAKASANQTYAAQLTQLKTTYDTLTDEEKMRTALRIGVRGTIFLNNSPNAATFSRPTSTAANAYIQQFDMNNASLVQVTMSTSGNSFATQSSSTNSSELYLMLLSNY